MKKAPKAIAMYLPQFHRIEENDKWWGEGFTEWTTVRAAKPLYQGHEQPKYPLKQNYYNLLNQEVVKWQADLMKKYGIYGLCYYHYWFKKGRRILEKPAENLLKWRDIDMPFCFCWANESWVCSWSNVRNGNVWAGEYEIETPQNKNGILLEQKYGDKKDWIEHFIYLLPFFQDERYIKKDNKPVFLIYKPLELFCLSEMLFEWNKLAQKAGFDGIYLIGANSDSRIRKILDAELIHEPQATFLEKYSFEEIFEKREGMNRVALYDDIWRHILDRKINSRNVFYGGFCRYDDSPRKGRKGVVVEGDTPEKFKQYLTKLYAKNVAAGNEFVFINAWNEWGEGMYLEPDEKDIDGYLQAFSYAEKHFMYEEGNISQDGNERETDIGNKEKAVAMWKQKCNRYESYWRTFHKWLQLKEEHKELSDFLIREGYKNIAIYGMGMMARHLQKELEDTEINIIYGIDKKAYILKADIPLFLPEDTLPEIDAIIVTAVYDYNEIADQLRKKGIKHILCLEEIIEEC